MKLHLHSFDLPLRHTFTIARGSVDVQPTLIVELEEDGLHGYGEATTNSYYGATLESMTAALEGVRGEIETPRLWDPAALWKSLHPKLRGNPFAHCALDQAAHDLWGKMRGAPVWKLWGLSIENTPLTNYTIGIDDIDVMVAKMQEFPGWPVYKIKLGTDHDLEIVQALRRHTDAVFRVDANCGWTADEAIANSEAMKDLGVEFIEQPLPADQWRDMGRVFGASALAGHCRRKLRGGGRRGPLRRRLPRREHQAGQVRRHDPRPADDRPRPGVGPQNDGRLHDGIDGGHFGHRSAPAPVGLRRHGRRPAPGPRHRHGRRHRARPLPLPDGEWQRRSPDRAQRPDVIQGGFPGLRTEEKPHLLVFFAAGASGIVGVMFLRSVQRVPSPA
jgi:hypothetical protein